MQIGMRRCLRVLYVLVAAGTLAALPVLIVDFRNHDWSVHYKVRASAPGLCTRICQQQLRSLLLSCRLAHL